MSFYYHISNISDLDLPLPQSGIVFIKGDLGAGKTTLSRSIIQAILGKDTEVTSPTYTYYNKYEDIYHFDLYRLKNYDEFFAIGGEDILDNHDGLILIEWPELIAKHYDPNIEIVLEKTDIPDQRKISITVLE